MGHSLNGYRLCQKQSELGDFEERSPIIRGIRYAVIFAGTGTWRPSRRALYYPSRACTMNVGIKMFGSSAVNSCPGSPALVLAVQVAESLCSILSWPGVQTAEPEYGQPLEKVAD